MDDFLTPYGFVQEADPDGTFFFAERDGVNRQSRYASERWCRLCLCVAVCDCE